MKPLSYLLLRSRRREAHRSAGPGPVDPTPLRRLIAGELRWSLRQAVHPLKLGAAVVVSGAIVAAFGPLSPGLVLSAGWRLTLAAGLGITAAVVAHGLLERRGAVDDDERRGPLRAVLAASALLVTGTVLLGSLLAAVVGSPDPAAPAALDAGLAVDLPLLTGAALLALGVLAAALGARLRVPGALLFLALGMVMGDGGLAVVSLSDPVLVQSLGVGALVVILFEGGLTTGVDELRRGAAPGVLLATVGVVVTAGVTALGAMWLLDVPSRVAWLVGAIVASTDAAAVFDMLRRAPLPARLAAVLKVESGANDPVAVLLTVGLLSVWSAPPSGAAWVVFAGLQLVGGVAVGVAAGALASWLLHRLRLATEGLYPILALAVAGMTYGTAVTVGASGFLATYLAGVVLAHDVPRRRRALQTFHTALANGVEIGLFLLLGLLVAPAQLAVVAPTALGLVAVLVLVGRPLACATILAPLDFSARGIAVVSWLGMRGAVPIVLATFAYSAGIPSAALLFHVVFFIVVVSALVQGTTAVPLITALGLAEPASTRDVIAGALPIEGTGIDLVEVAVPADSGLVGATLAQVPAPGDALVTALVRGDEVMLPRGSTRIEPADLLVVTTTDGHEGTRRIERWARSAAVPPPRDAPAGDVPTP